MRRVVACVIGIGAVYFDASLGCGQFAGDGDASTDAGVDAKLSCQTGVFGNVVAIAELNTAGDERGMRLSPDERVAVFGRSKTGDGGPGLQAFQAARDSSTGPFAVPFALYADGFYPNVTSDLLGFFSEGGCVWKNQPAPGSLCARERDSGTAQTFSYPWPAYGSSLITGPFGAGFAVGDGIVTSDGGTYYFVGPSDAGVTYAVFSAHRGGAPITGSVFGTPTLQLAPNEVLVDNPVVSFDELTMFVSVTSASEPTPHVQVAARATTSELFGVLSPVHELDSSEGEYPTWLSPDRCRLYISRRVGGQWELYVASRAE